MGQYLKKGSAIYVEGRIRTRKWTDKEGQERFTTVIEANEMQMLGSRNSSSAVSKESSSAQPQTSGGGGNESCPPVPGFLDAKDIPFVESSMAFDLTLFKASRTRSRRNRL